MALVPEKTYLQWYDQDSWMYKQFSYIFQNPLWKASSVPSGFSLCPYFWMSLLFGFFFLKLFFVPTMLCIGKVLHIFPFAGKLYSKCISGAMKLVGMQGFADEIEAKPAASALVPVIIALIIATVGGIGFFLYSFVTGIIPAFWFALLDNNWWAILITYIIIGVPMCIIVKNYTDAKIKSGKTPCPAWVYVKILALFAICHMGYFAYPPIVTELGYYWDWSVMYMFPSIAEFFQASWSWICSVPGGFWRAFMSQPFGMPPVGPSIIALWIGMIVFMRIYIKLCEKITSKMEVKTQVRMEVLKKESVENSNWADLFAVYINSTKSNRSVKTNVEFLVRLFLEKKLPGDDHKLPFVTMYIIPRMTQQLIDKICYRFVEVPESIKNRASFVEANGKMLKNLYKLRKGEHLTISDITGVEELDDIMAEMSSALRNAAYGYSLESEKAELIGKFTESQIKNIYGEMKDLIKQNTVKYRKKSSARIARKKKLDKMCGSVCGTVGATWSNVVAKPAVGTWSFVCQFFTYMKAMIKANKQKACPYIQFHKKDKK